LNGNLALDKIIKMDRKKDEFETNDEATIQNEISLYTHALTQSQFDIEMIKPFQSDDYILERFESLINR
jgi:IMP cyclohydrolase